MMSATKQTLKAISQVPMFRFAVLFSGLFAISTLLLFAFIYWQTAVVETNRVDTILVSNAAKLARQSPDQRRTSLDLRVMPDLHFVVYAALFDNENHRLVGNFPAFPGKLPFDGLTHRLVMPMADNPSVTQAIRAVGIDLPDGTRLVIGHDVESLDNLRNVVGHALELGLIPAVLLALGAGLLVSQRTHLQLEQVHKTAERIMRGDLCERLPVRGSGDDFDRLANSVNLMLDQIARLMDDMKSVGDNIAHDLRTPLNRVRNRLERARDPETSPDEVQEMVDRAIAGLDQALRMITALLRIGEIEDGRRRAAFESVDLKQVADEIADLYEPFAEEKGVHLELRLDPVRPVRGDRDLLCELLSNLVDNAIKFTPAGGQVGIELANGPNALSLRVVDSGPGIPLEYRESVFKRFFRTDASRSVSGYGLGLSLVDAIVKLHGFRLRILDNRPGCIFDLQVVTR
jgi:signal transduction histidine kinase